MQFGKCILSKLFCDKPIPVRVVLFFTPDIDLLIITFKSAKLQNIVLSHVINKVWILKKRWLTITNEFQAFLIISLFVTIYYQISDKLLIHRQVSDLFSNIESLVPRTNLR